VSTQAIGGTGAINVTGLASGLNTNEIINALLSVERRPVAQLSNEQSKLQAQQTQLRQTQSSLQQLTFSAADLASPALFETAQTVSSSDPNQVTATTSTGAGVGGYQVNVTQLANSAQRTFTFASPASEDTLTIDGHELTVKAGTSIQSLANTINSTSGMTVYAAALDGETLVLSNRATGNTGEGFIGVSDPGGTLTEKAGTAKQGRDAEYTVDGVAGASSTNTVTNAIAGVTLSLNALTTVSGPVTINVAAPAPNASSIGAQVQSFVKLYNSTIGSIETQLNTKPPANPQSAGELGSGTLFGDSDLSGLLNAMRQQLYTPVEGLPAGMSALTDIGISTGAASGSATPSAGSLAGELTLDSEKLTKAIQTDPEGVQKLLAGWAQGFQKLVNVDAEPGGTLETRINGDATQVVNLTAQITTMNEMLAVRERSLKAQFAAMEAIISRNQSQSSWLTGQINAISANSIAGIASSSSKGG
jgi:flagellar hook-associated protein 2